MAGIGSQSVLSGIAESVKGFFFAQTGQRMISRRRPQDRPDKKPPPDRA